MNDPTMTVTLLTGDPEFRIVRRGDRCGLVRGDDEVVAAIRRFVDTGILDIPETGVSSPDRAFCAVHVDDGRLAITMSGGVVIELDDGMRLEATSGRISRALAENEVTAWGATSSSRPTPDPDSDFEAGSVRGAGFVIRLSGHVTSATPTSIAPRTTVPVPDVPPPVTVPTPTVPPPPAERHFQVFSLTSEPDPIPPPPPTTPVGNTVVEGVRCSRAHFNDPRARYCSVCGISMLQTSIVIERAERPALGVLIFSDGSHETVDVPLVIGREPDDVRVTEVDGRAVVLADPNKRLSRVHAIVDLDGWDAVVRDGGSTNGTFVWRLDSQSWSRLAPGERHVLTSGDRIAFADVVVTFESGHQH